MKIKLKRSVWNHNVGDEFEVTESNGKWAVKKGLADPIEDENKAIVPEYKKRVKTLKTK